METDRALQLLLAANQLKRVPRIGWLMRGVADAESVSDHAFGVAFVSLVLAQMTEQSVDTAKLLSMALLHDLPEAVLGDIPSPASKYLPVDAKGVAEQEALRSILDGIAWGDEWLAWARELEEQASVEARLVRDADRIEMLLQAYVYAQTTGSRCLDEFWTAMTGRSFEFEASRSVFGALCDRRKQSLEAD